VNESVRGRKRQFAERSDGGTSGRLVRRERRAVGSGSLVVGRAPGEDRAARVTTSRPRIPDTNDSFGARVAAGAAGITVGAPLEDSNSLGINGAQGNDVLGGTNFNSGAVYVFPQ
jgi:hypothetical protein